MQSELVAYMQNVNSMYSPKRKTESQNNAKLHLMGVNEKNNNNKIYAIS